jgi:hypothetical protein
MNLNLDISFNRTIEQLILNELRSAHHSSEPITDATFVAIVTKLAADGLVVVSDAQVQLPD